MVEQEIKNHIPISIYYPENIPPDKSAREELNELVKLSNTIIRLKEYGSLREAEYDIKKMVFTPDFHKGAGIPIGTVMLTRGLIIPQAMGKDINCGMRLYITDVKEDQIRNYLICLKKKLRYIFFEGGREIPMTGRQRKALFCEGLSGLQETWRDTQNIGIWNYFDAQEQERQLPYVAFRGSLRAEDTEGLTDFIGDYTCVSYDTQIGSVGGGNHFVEIQRICDIFDAQTANAWGIKKNQVVIMIHSGSLTIGHHSGMLGYKIAEAIYPKSVEQPENKIYLIPDEEEKALRRFWNTAYNAANFAFANRLFLGLMVQKAFTEVLGDCHMKLLYDSPHNFIWKEAGQGGQNYLHRKGACSACGLEQMEDTPFAYYGEPVMIPGSMGGFSYLLRGNGNKEALCSASHGAGRRLSRGEAIHGNDLLFKEFMKRFSIVTPIDPERNDLKGRKDILKKWEETIRAEAPYAYKDINEVTKVHIEHRLADYVARMEPILTIKA